MVSSRAHALLLVCGRGHGGQTGDMVIKVGGIKNGSCDVWEAIRSSQRALSRHDLCCWCGLGSPSLLLLLFFSKRPGRHI